MILESVHVKVEQNILGYMSAHEGEGPIKPIQKTILLNMLLGISLSTHSHPIHAKISQGHLHIFPPITVVEGCKDLGYEI